MCPDASEAAAALLRFLEEAINKRQKIMRTFVTTRSTQSKIETKTQRKHSSPKEEKSEKRPSLLLKNLHA